MTVMHSTQGDPRKKILTTPYITDKVHKGPRYTQKLYRDTTHLYTKLHLSPRFTHFQKGPLPLVLVIVISKVCTSKNHRKKNIPISPHSIILTKANSPRNFFIFLLFSMGLPPHNPWELKELSSLFFLLFLLLFTRRSFFV